MFDGKVFGEQMVEVVGSYVDQATAPLLKRIEELEARAAPADGAPGRDGVDGKDADPPSDEQVAKAVAEYLAANPPPAGRDGKDGKDGKDGRDGAPGEKGQDGKDGVGAGGAVIDR